MVARAAVIDGHHFGEDNGLYSRRPCGSSPFFPRIQCDSQNCKTITELVMNVGMSGRGSVVGYES